MSRTLLPAAAHIICEHGSHVLLIKRSLKTDPWPGYWAFPGGKLEDGELFRECALREAREEVGIVSHEESIKNETIVMSRTVQWVKLNYFGLLDQWDHSPEILEPNLATDIGWFTHDALPEPIIPHHRVALNAIMNWVWYTEYDVAP
jgi:8-oxo-dGTP diphosphatase